MVLVYGMPVSFILMSTAVIRGTRNLFAGVMGYEE